LRAFLIIVLTLTFGLTFGQDFLYPTVKSNGDSVTDFVPSGWTILDSAFGDLNNDNLDDIAFVLQRKDSITFIRQEFNDTVITQPRILAIAFYNASTKQYDLVEQSNSFILNHDNPIMDDPFQDISISKQVLKIDFNIWSSMGSWEMSNNSYKFRYQDKEFKLIGSDYNSVNRGSGETEDRSYNFLTKKIKHVSGNISSDKQKINWKTFKIGELKTFRTFTKPFTWEVETDFYL